MLIKISSYDKQIFKIYQNATVVIHGGNIISGLFKVFYPFSNFSEIHECNTLNSFLVCRFER